MTALSRRTWLALCALWVAAPAALPAEECHSARQYYSDWHKSPKHDYHYRHYYYKPHADYAGYKHNYMIVRPSDPKHAYYYNPYKKQYWGRCNLDHGGVPEYSLLPPEYRKAALSDIPESAFPKGGPLPPLPESTDGTKLDLPPDNLPPDLGTPE